jgi:hypothetical protein
LRCRFAGLLTPLLAWWTIQTRRIDFTTNLPVSTVIGTLKFHFVEHLLLLISISKKVTMNWAVYHDDLGFAFCF